MTAPANVAAPAPIATWVRVLAIANAVFLLLAIVGPVLAATENSAGFLISLTFPQVVMWAFPPAVPIGVVCVLVVLGIGATGLSGTGDGAHRRRRVFTRVTVAAFVMFVVTAVSVGALLMALQGSLAST
ncbi:hypothetical protein [Microbacterium sp. bgisy203]|uniref:hypothetical protein n=1 Tax=Microbacterium sp. bgisy203 TaxID=3413799 RepID=UPI003D71B21C